MSPEGRQCLVHSCMADAQASHTRCSITIKWTRYFFLFIPLGLTLFCFCIFISNISERWSLTIRGSVPHHLSSQLGTTFCHYSVLSFPLCQRSSFQAVMLKPQVKRHFAISESIQLSISSMKMIYKSLQPWLLSCKLICISNFHLVNSMQILFFFKLRIFLTSFMVSLFQYMAHPFSRYF